MDDFGPFHRLADRQLVAFGVHEAVFVDDVHEKREIEFLQSEDGVGGLPDRQDADVVTAFPELFRKSLRGNARPVAVRVVHVNDK